MSRKTIWEITIGVLAILSIVLVAIEAMGAASGRRLLGLYIADLAICIVFAVDFIHRLAASESKRRFFRTSWYEILAMVPAVSLYALGAASGISAVLRLLRLVRVVFLLARMRRAMSASKGFFGRSNLLAMMGITVSVILVGAFSVFLLEIGTANTQIHNFSDAVWWSLSTVTTVGYGDIVPHSFAGRLIGMFLMVIGIGVMTAFISQVSAALVESRMRQAPVKPDLKNAVTSEIINRIENIDKLSDSEVSLLLKMIQALKDNASKNG